MSSDDFSKETVGRLVEIMRDGETRDAIGACKSLIERKIFVEEARERLQEAIREGEARDAIRAAEVLTKQGREKPLSVKQQLAMMSDDDLIALCNADVAPELDPLLL